ncbi:MAG: flippase [Patescibacteria group bacterium]
MSLTRQVAQNTIIQAIGKIGGTALGAIAAFFLFRYLGDYHYGEYTTIMVYMQIFGILIDLGLFIVMIKNISETRTHEETNKLVNNIFTFRLVTGLGFLITAIIISWFIPSYNLIIRWGIAIASIDYLFLTLSQILMAVYQKHMAMGRVAIAEIISKLFLFGSTLSVIYIFKTSLLTVVMAVALTAVINFSILYLGALKYYRVRLAFDFDVWKKIFGQSWPMALSISLNMLYFKADTLMLGWFKPQTDVGIYGAAYKILEVIITLPAMFVGLVMPVLTRSFANHDMEKFKKVFQRSFDALCLIVLPMIAGTMVVAKPLMLLLAGDKFTVEKDALGICLQILIWAVGFIFIGTLTGYLIVILNKQKAAIKAYGFVAATALIGYFIFIPRYSYYGAAAVTVYSEAVMMLFGFYYLYKVTKIFPQFNIFFRAAFASLIMAFVLWILPSWNVLILIGIGMAVYALSIYFFKGISKQDILEITSLKNNG